MPQPSLASAPKPPSNIRSATAQNKPQPTYSHDLIQRHDLIHDLSRRRLMLRQYEQFIANAHGDDALLAFWQRQRKREMQTILELKQLIAEHGRHV